ncbi:MAG: type II toxin-antitoxin system Phd/YefM family antitoxin [Jiangellaceae bacterium]
MTVIPARDLRNHTAEILRRVEAGEQFEVHRNSQPIAKIVPLRQKRRWIPAAELVPRLGRLGPDRTGLRADIDEDVAGSTDEVAW